MVCHSSLNHTLKKQNKTKQNKKKIDQWFLPTGGRKEVIRSYVKDIFTSIHIFLPLNVGNRWFRCFHQAVSKNYINMYFNKRVLSLTHMLILNVYITTSMHGLYMSTQHLDETLEPLNWIRVLPSRRDKHSRKRSHVLYYVSCNISNYMTFKPRFFAHASPLREVVREKALWDFNKKKCF